MKVVSLAILSLVLSAHGFAQDAPLEDKFNLEASLSHRKLNLKSYEDYLSNFNEKYFSARELEDKQSLVISKLEDEKKRIEGLPEKKQSKQEKEYLMLTKCMKGFITGEGSKTESATSINQCFYTHNVDSRHFRKTKSGKILGESYEIQKEGDELSKLVDTLMHSDLREDQVKMLKEYRGAKEYKATLETSAIARANNDIEILEKKVAARAELDKLIAKNLDCSSQLKLDLNNTNTDVVGDMFSAVLKKEYGPSQVNDKVCSSFDSVRLSLMFKETNPDCEIVKPNLSGLYCDKSMTPNIIYEKDKMKALNKLRLIVVTQLTQKLPVGISREKKNSAIIGLKKDKGECMYLVKDYQVGASEWMSEKSVLEKLEEIQHLKRQ